MRKLTVYVCLGLALTLAKVNATTPEDRGPPVARSTDVVDHEFGLALPDPYRWMEGNHNEEFQAWLDGQSSYARRQLDKLSTLSLWRQRLDGSTAGIVSNTSYKRAGGRLFFIRRESKGAGMLCVRDSNGRDRVLLNPNELDHGTASITEYEPSPNGKRVAINIDHGGGEITKIQVMDVNSGKWLPDEIERVWGEFNANWYADSRGFTYTQMAPEGEHPGGDPMQGMRVRTHILGLSTGEDAVLLYAGAGELANKTLILESKDFPKITSTPNSNWVYATASGARPARRLCLLPSTSKLTRRAKWECVANYDDAVYGQTLRGDSLFLISTKAAPTGRIIALDLARSKNRSLRDAQEVLSETTDSTITDIVAARDALYAKRMKNGFSEVLRIDYVTHKVTPLTLPSAGAVRELSADAENEGVVLSLEGWTSPPSAYLNDVSQNRFNDLKLGTESNADYGMITSVEIEAVSEDGTHVPLSLMYRKDIKLDDLNPAILYGYGGYGISLEPRFSPLNLEWVKAGGIFAFAHVRGGGEKGDNWRVDGQGRNKHKGVEDLFACAKELENLHYSNAKHIGLYGRSMGGVLIGGALTQTPEAFGAAVIGVGLLNPVRLLAAPNGANQIAEVGDPRTAEGLKTLAEMDPYLNIQYDKKYPATLLILGANDGRVPVWETGKFAAKLLAWTSDNKPIWIRTDMDAGHGINSSFDSAAAERADVYAFLDTQISRNEQNSRTN